MTQTMHPTRALLLDRALAVADEQPFAATSIDHIVRAAGVAKGTFYVHFRDRDEFLAALHDHFHDQLRERITAATAGMPPGAARLRRGCEAYLDGCLEARGVKAMMAGARSEPVIDRKVATSNDRFARVCARELKAMGLPRPLDRARLVVAAVAEVALLEIDSGRRSTLRHALWDLILVS